MLTLSHWGKTIKTVNYPFLVFFPNHLFLPEVVDVVITWEWEEYGQQFELSRAPIFEKCFLTPGASKNPKTYAHSTMDPRFSLPHVFGAPGHSPFTFQQCSSFFPWLGSGFVNVQWLGSLLGIFMLFPHSHGWEFHVLSIAQPMGDRSTNLRTEGVVFAHVKAQNVSKMNCSCWVIFS